MVDNGGKITDRHNGFYVGEDGSQFPTAYISDKPVRMMIEYDNISQNFNNVALAFGNQRMDGVPITPIDASQPAGVMPARATAATGAAAVDANGNPIDKTNAAISNIQDKKNKAKSFWQQMKDTANTAKSTADPKQ